MFMVPKHFKMKWGLPMNLSVLPASCRQKNRRKALPTRRRQHLVGVTFRLVRGFTVAMHAKYERIFAMNTKPSPPSSSLSERLSRRYFSKLLASSALAMLAAPAFLRGQNLNSKLNVAIIGAGGRGGSNLADVGNSENIVAVCDV